MHESKAELKDRLREDGNWEAFIRCREQLKADGMPASDAWDAAAEEFPAPDGDQPDETAPTVDLRALKDKPPVSVVDAAGWAFEHLDANWISPADAPSSGAWSLREWARSNLRTRSEFYKMFAGRLVSVPQKASQQAENEMTDWDLDLERRLSGALPPNPDPVCAAQECADRSVHGE